MSKIIQLNETECNVACNHGLSRYFKNREVGNMNQSIKVKNHPIFTEIDGIAGEIAVAKLLGVYPDIDPTPRVGGADLVSKTGVRVEVKTTHHETGKLIAQKWKTPKDSDIYVLVIGSLPEFDIRGWMYSTELLRPERLEEQKSGYCFVARQEELNPMTEKPQL